MNYTNKYNKYKTKYLKLKKKKKIFSGAGDHNVNYESQEIPVLVRQVNYQYSNKLTDEVIVQKIQQYSIDTTNYLKNNNVSINDRKLLIKQLIERLENLQYNKTDILYPTFIANDINIFNPIINELI